ncbi:diguanylate cyclase (GGDEF domain) with PAS/PAC sensor [hydrothermal vent metagenome]|uniref:Diguanylate cyclase (GGDEF domain) with PAS/PAC sensor n=1 Tax=hydrothermal vent metagenome TaxID=652676 RepID=A0A1W1EKA4_9ZZZZ
MKIRKIFLVFIFIILNLLIYKITDINRKERIEIALNSSIKDLQTHYSILKYSNNKTADAIYESTIKMIPNFIELFKEANSATKEKQNIIRKKLFNILKKKYDIIKHKGIWEYHFILSNNVSFLRMHKPDKFGDNLTNIREDIVYVNINKKPIKGFVKGRTTHGFRNSYPIFDKDGRYIGVLGISFGSEMFQEYLTNISKIHTHFIVNKDVFNSKLWKRDDINLKYTVSAENKNFMLMVDNLHSMDICVIQNSINLNSIRDDIDKNFKKGDRFAVYTRDKNRKIEVVTFIPIKNIYKDKVLAWLVSYKKSPFIYSTLESCFTIRLLSFLLFLLLLYFILKDLERLQDKELNITKKAYTDTLTQVFNRDKFDEILNEYFKKDIEYKKNLSIVIIDIDKFKDFNDKFGHLIGDEVLIMIAQYINSNIRKDDIFARWGGEEFIILFSNTPLNIVEIISNKLRIGIENLLHKEAGKITASFGVTQYRENDTIESLFKRCDDALYQAKESGRNRVCVK